MSRHRSHRLDEPVDAELDRLRKAYADRDIGLDALAARFRLCAPRVTEIAKREGWPLRRTNRTRANYESNS